MPLMLVVLVLAGCPSSPGDKPAPDVPVVKDAFSDFGEVMVSQDAFYSELRRLQRLYTSNPGLGGIMPGNMDSRYELSSRLDDGQVGLVLTDGDSGEEWVLWVLCDEQDPLSKSDVVRDQATAGGYKLELNIGSGSLAVSVTAHWVQNRYLQVSRELMLGGLDHFEQAADRLTTWRLDGPWLPYRLIPANAGPYGVVKARCADGGWHGHSYPGAARVPAIASYDRLHGMLLCIVDEHPRKLDRNYTMEYRIAGDYSYGGLARIGRRHFDPTQDGYTRAALVSGLPVRDSVVLEPLQLSAQSIDATLIEAETTQVLYHLADAVHAFHFRPEPPEATRPGSLVVLEDWAATPPDAVGFADKASARWNTVGAVVPLESARLGTTQGQVASQPAEGGEAEIPPPQPSVSASLKEFEIETFAPLRISPFTEADGSHTDIRDPQFAARLARDAVQALEPGGRISGYIFAVTEAGSVAAQEPGQGDHLISCDAAAAVQCMFTASEISERIPDSLSASQAVPCLAFPAFASAQINAVDLAPIGQGVSQGEIGAIRLANRLSSYLDILVFGVNPYVSLPDSSLAQQVLATVGGVRGHLLGKSLEQYYGFDAYATHQRELRGAGGELLTLHAAPESCGYLSSGERPAELTELVAVLPADLQGASAVWVAFHGVGGSVAVDEYNNLTVTWGDWGLWRDKLPVGYWVVDHPEPETVIAGDAVLVIRKPVPGVQLPGTDWG